MNFQPDTLQQQELDLEIDFVEHKERCRPIAAMDTINDRFGH